MGKLALRIAAIFVLEYLIIATASLALARDLNGVYASKDPALHEWFDKLRSGKGPCCSFADGVRVEDVDWESECSPSTGSISSVTCTFKVRLEGQWIVVPDDALILEPNLARTAVVWPYVAMENGVEVTKIRCFMPGTGV
jgi:hypothetical protein